MYNANSLVVAFAFNTMSYYETMFKSMKLQYWYFCLLYELFVFPTPYLFSLLIYRMYGC